MKQLGEATFCTLKPGASELEGYFLSGHRRIVSIMFIVECKHEKEDFHIVNNIIISRKVFGCESS